jgi:hypothetical protein
VIPDLEAAAGAATPSSTAAGANPWLAPRPGDRGSSAASAPRSDHLAATEAALTERFPHVPHPLVRELVHDAYRSFADARIHDFIPLLVQRIVCDRLAADRPNPGG